MNQRSGEQMIFAPLTTAQVRALRDDGPIGDVRAFAATPELMAALDYNESRREDAEYAALSYASVQALLQPEPIHQRWVLAAKVDDALLSGQGVSGAPNHAYGEVVVGSLDWSAVVAIFVDDSAAAAAVAATHQAINDADLPGAWDDAHVADLIRDHDLLWHLPDELDQIT